MSKTRSFSAFTLAEMTVVMLVITIAMAASAPIITSKMRASSGGNGSASPWKWAQNETDTFFGPASGQRAMVGISGLTADDNAKLVINTTSTYPNHIAFKKDGSTIANLLIDDSDNNFVLGSGKFGKATHSQLYSNYAGILSQYSGTGSTAIGINALMTDKGGFYNTAVGFNALASSRLGINNVAVGYNALSRLRNGEGNVAIGSSGVGTTNWTSRVPTRVYGSVAIGQDALAGNTGATAIGSYYLTGSSYGISANTHAPEATGGGSIAIGSAFVANSGPFKSEVGQLTGLNGARALSDFSIAIGPGSKSGENADGGISIGHYAMADALSAVSIGRMANSAGENAIAVGYSAHASGENSVAIGPRTIADENNTIVLGCAEGTTGCTVPKVIINGDLEVKGKVSLAQGSNIELSDGASLILSAGSYIIDKNGDKLTTNPHSNGWSVFESDRRLKYVGTENKAGLEKIKDLKIFNYTYKSDDKKVPHVGVIAQDLQKIFPDAVSKGEDGFLRVRMEDMFYAVVNAIKELDSKISELMQLKQEVKQLKLENAELKARLDQLEARMK